MTWVPLRAVAPLIKKKGQVNRFINWDEYTLIRAWFEEKNKKTYIRFIINSSQHFYKDCFLLATGNDL